MPTYEAPPTGRRAIGFEQLTVDNTTGGVGFTATKYKDVVSAQALLDSTFAICTLEGTAGTNDIRWTVDGTAPTTSVGHLLKAGENLNLAGYGNITKFRAIRTGGSSGTLSVTFFL